MVYNIDKLLNIYIEGKLIQYLKDNIINTNKYVDELLKYPLNISTWVRDGKVMTITISDDNNHSIFIDKKGIYFNKPYQRIGLKLELKEQDLRNSLRIFTKDKFINILI